MNFDKYQKRTRKEASYPKRQSLDYLSMGLVQKTGEISKEAKGNILRNTDDFDVKSQVRDSFWILTRICDELDKSVEEIMEMETNPKYYDSDCDICSISSLVNLKAAEVSVLISKGNTGEELDESIAEAIVYLQEIAKHNGTNLGELVKGHSYISETR